MHYMHYMHVMHVTDFTVYCLLFEMGSRTQALLGVLLLGTLAGTMKLVFKFGKLTLTFIVTLRLQS